MEERQEGKSQEQPAQKTCTCPSPEAAAATWHDKEQGTRSDESNLVRGTLRARGDEKIREETKKPKPKCLNQCNVDVQNMENKLIEKDPTFVVSSSQQSGEKRQAWKRQNPEKTKYFIDDEEWGITTNSATVLSTVMARNIVKKISTEGPFPCGAVNLNQRDKTSKVH